MTVKQISDLFNVSTETVKRAIRELYPDLMRPRKRTILNKEQATAIGGKIRSAGYLTQNESDLTQNESAPPQNAEVEKRIDRLESLLEKIITILPQMIGVKETPKEIEAPLYTVKEYLKLSGLTLTEQQKIQIGKIAVIMTKKKNGSLKYCEEDGFYGIGKYSPDILDVATSKIIDQENGLFK